MEKKKISNELSEHSPEKQTPSEKPKSKGSAHNVLPKRNSVSSSKKSSSRTARKKSETGLSHNTDKKLEHETMHENITVGSLEENKEARKSVNADSRGAGSAKGGKKAKLSKKSTGDTANKQGVLEKKGSAGTKKDQPESESIRQSKHGKPPAADHGSSKSANQNEHKRSSSARSPAKTKDGDGATNEMLQTQTKDGRKDKQELLPVEGSVITGKGDVEQFEKLQGSINSLSIDVEDDRESKGLKAQGESTTAKEEETKKD